MLGLYILLYTKGDKMLQLSIDNSDKLVDVCKALSTELRINILKILGTCGPLNIQELAKQLNCAVSTVSVNIKVMEDAGLIISDRQPAKNGENKICSLVYWEVLLNLFYHPENDKMQHIYEDEILIGNFQSFSIEPSCGYIFSKDNVINTDILTDDKYSFYRPERIQAQLIWFRMGYVEYEVPIRYIFEKDVQSVSFSMEICSEAPGFNNTWKSDITMHINDVEIGTWLCSGDFGGRRGNFTPPEWPLDCTQYGILTKWIVTTSGSFMNDQKISDICIDDLHVNESQIIKMRIGVKHDAENLGGINIFSDKYGDYPQNIKMNISYI